jgi:uncharacterized protein
MQARRLTSPLSIQERLARLDWEALERSLWDWGWAKTPPLLTAEECADLTALYDDGSRFRSRVDMARFQFGLGEYKYFAEPLPPVVERLRQYAYPPLAAIANRWEAALGGRKRFPPDLDGLLARCAERGQTKPTPLILQYGAGGYNCLHQDLYGDVVFPLQLTCALSRRGEDYAGGEFLLVEQRPRAQSRGEVVLLEQGEAVIFATRDRPMRSKKGFFRARMRHGVSRVVSGERYTLGVIFHNAQ